MAYDKPQEGVSVTTEKGGTIAPAGLWRHPQSGQEAITQHDPLYGNSQSQAFSRTGFEFVRDVDQSEIKSLPELGAQDRAVDDNTLKGVQARLNQIEASQNTVKTLEEENRELRKQVAATNRTEADVSGDHAKANAVENTDGVEMTSDGGVVKTDETSDTSSDETKSLDKQNREELEATALEAGVEDPSNQELYKTKADLVAAIEDARDQNTESENE